MDAIKKKMQAMKLEKDNAQDKADAMEGQFKDANARAEKINEEVRELQKKLSQVENDLVTNKQLLEDSNKELENKEKQLTQVGTIKLLIKKLYREMCAVSRPSPQYYVCYCATYFLFDRIRTNQNLFLHLTLTMSK